MIHDFSTDSRFKGLEPLKKRIWLASPTMHGEEEKWIHEAFTSNWVTTSGENINQIEASIAQMVGVKYAVALSSGTAALHLATKLAAERLYGTALPNTGTLSGKKVFCSDLTFDASVNPVAYEDGEAVFIDTGIDDWNMDPKALSKAFDLYPEVRLIILAHLYGTPGNVEEIRKIADEHNALIVEDAAESFGAEVLVDRSSSPYFFRTADGVQDKQSNIWLQTGSLGDYSAISFNGNKIITGSCGGMFLTNEKAGSDKVRKWSTQSREAAPWYQHEEIGYNYRMSNIVAGVVRGQLGYLQEHINRKRAIYEKYKAAFADLPVKMNPYHAGKTKPNYWLSCLIIEESALAPHVRSDNTELWAHVTGKSNPGEILSVMRAFGIEGRPIWKPMHLQPIYRNSPFITAKGTGRGKSNAYIASQGGEDVDNGADIFARGLCLPSDIKMSGTEQDYIIDVIRRCFR